MMDNQEEDVKSLSIKKDKQKADVFGRWVKLKIPKEGHQEAGMDIGDQKIGFKNKDQMNMYSNNIKRVCHICHKAFSSGKALGGHMRIHVQRANKKDLVSKKKLKVHQTITFKKQNPREEVEENVIDLVKKKHHFKKKTRTADCYGGSDNMIKKPTCIICGKDFPSMKSLFGHMRCHPERDWRGIHPPSSMEKKSSSSSLSDADPPKIDDQMGLLASGEKNRAVDLTESLRGWPVTARRGRRAMAAASSSELSSSEDDQLRDAVNYLMMLARGASLESGVTHRQKLCESEAANSFYKAKILKINRVSELKKRMIDQSSVGIRTLSPVEQLGNEQRGSNEDEKAVIARSGLVHEESVNKLEGQEWLEDYEHNYFSDDDQMDSKNTGQLSDTAFESNNFKVLIKNKKKRKKVKLCDLELAKTSPVTPVHQKVVEMTSMTLPPDKYRCNTCDKSFPTHQALGGHRSSHNKFNITIHNSMEEKNNLSNPTAQVEETKEHDKRDISSNLVDGTQHQHLICNKNFSTAQALGGHKRCCGSGLVEAPLSEVSSPSEASHICRRVLDFDLNARPPSEDEAGFESELSLGHYVHASLSIY